MLVLNAGISHNSKDWLMWRDKKRTRLREEMLVQFQTGIPFGYLIITGVVELGFRSILYEWKAKT